MGNTHVKPHPRSRNKKQVHWKAAARPFPPGKPQLISETEATPDLVTIRWTKSSNDGGSPISGYLVEHRRTGSPHWVRSTPLLVQIPELTISGLEPGWRYQFRVSAQNAVGISDPSELSEPITVTLQRSAVTAPRFTQELLESTSLENEKIEFVVHFLGQPAPKVCWFKDGFEIFSSRRIRILTESARSVLTIHQCSLSDEGEIKCTATNRAGHVSTKAKLTVEAPPSIRLPRQYEDGILFEIGELIRLKVSIAGRPTPLVFWSHNGETLKTNERCEVEYVDRCSILKVNEAERDDRGEYQIKAVNKLGEDVQSFLVTVTDKPSPPGRAKVLMALGRSVTLSWNTPNDDGGCKIGNYIVEYYRLGWNVWLKAATSRQLTTILGDLIEGSEYKFRVKAESPYGISDPSEESEVIFIPDPKRGILQPQTRGRSQPRDVLQELGTPVAARRKNKPRSQSSSRVEDNYNEPDMKTNIQNAGVPKRPERNKIKSPPKTPEASPLPKKREINSEINKAIFERSDRSSMARELAYGSPDIKGKKDLNLPTNYVNSYYSSSSEKSRTPSPTPEKTDNHKVYTVKIEKSKPSSTVKLSRSPSPEIQRNKSPRENNETFTGSSEFMLVLYPDENEKGHSAFDFDDNSVPPPMSLSAPELGMDSPIFNTLKTSASSTELLHERAMIRFYQAAEAEEEELEKRRKANENRKQSVDIPKIQINSKDDENIVGLERKLSLRRRLSGGISHQQALWTQRRQSLKSPSELKSEMAEIKLHKAPVSADIKRELMMHRQRSESEEKEEQALEAVRKKMNVQGQSSFEKRKISVVDEEKWGDDYESSTEEDTDESEDEFITPKDTNFKRRISYEDDEEEMETYHPGANRHRVISDKEPFEILTKRRDPPDPSFIPKPILKKKEIEEHLIPKKKLSPEPSIPKSKSRSHSPMPQNITPRGRSHSLVDETLNMPPLPVPSKIPGKSRPRSFSLLPQKELLPLPFKKSDRPVTPETSTRDLPSRNISALAQVSGITAAGIVIPDSFMDKKKSDEEAKVVIDHYGDIVKNYGQRKRTNSEIYMDRDSLKRVAEGIETPEIDLAEMNRNRNDKGLEAAHDKPNKNQDYYKTDYRPSTSIAHYDTLPPNFKADKDASGSKLQKRERTISKSPTRQSSNSEAPRASPIRANRKSSKSPVRLENWDIPRNSRKTSPSPVRKEIGKKASSSPMRKEDNRNASTSQMRKGTRRKTSPSPMRTESKRRTSPSTMRLERTNTRTRSPSPITLSNYRPMLREIMTQTSVGLESFDSDAYSRTSTPSSKHEELMAQAEVKVRGFIDYTTDLAMFVVACWLYLFKNELFAIPIMLVMVYRQLQAEIARRIPKWILRRLKRKSKES